MTIHYANGSPSTSLTSDDLRSALSDTLHQVGNPQKVLLLPPDISRKYSRAGELTCLCYELLGDRVTDVMPALGTHDPMTEAELDIMFPGLPRELVRPHRWRDDVVPLGTVPAEFVEEATEGVYARPWSAQVNQLLRDGGHDLIFSIGQVVPHEVIGMANYNKNIFVGTGGKDGIHESHYLSALWGLERTLGRADTPLRRILNYAQDHFCQQLPLLYALTVIESMPDGTKHTRGLFIGDDHDTFYRAAALSEQVNIHALERPARHVVAYLEAGEFKSTWLGNKAIYRTRMAIADGGRLTILAPTVGKFGEDGSIDALIRKFGYRPQAEVVELVARHEDLAAQPSAAAHLIHGSSEGRFEIVYAAGKLSADEIRGVGYTPGNLAQLEKRYDVDSLSDGWHSDIDGSEFYFVRNPSLGLWRAEK